MYVYCHYAPVVIQLAHDKPGRFRASDNLANNDNDARSTTNTLVSVSTHVSLPSNALDYIL